MNDLNEILDLDLNKISIYEINEENRMYFCLFRDKYRLMEKI